MGLMHQPDQLQDIALDIIVQHVNSLYKNSTVETWKHLELELKHKIPPVLANTVTGKLLMSIIKPGRKFNFSLRELISAIILPSVTTLDLCPDVNPSGSFKDTIMNIAITFALIEVSALHKLEVLRIANKCPQNIVFPSSLVEFTQMYCCNQRTLKQLSENCNNLRKLNVGWSENVRNSCVEFILKFKCLEEVNVLGTNIKKIEMTRLLEGLARNRSETKTSILKRFGCNFFSPSQLAFLVENFKELDHLELWVDYENNHGYENNYDHEDVGVHEFQLLATLTHLESLVLVEEYSHYTEKILDAIGSQLTNLYLLTLRNFDIRVLGQKCTSLKTLYIILSGSFWPVPSVQELRAMPGLKHVESLSVEGMKGSQLDSLVSLCRDIKYLKVDVFHEVPVLVYAILDYEPMTELRELIWNCDAIGRDDILRIVQHCPNLEILRGTYVWNKTGNEAQRQKNYLLSSD